jgi:tRNA modification GTPase
MRDTIAAIATPNAVGGISVIRLSGSEALTVADRIFVPVSGKKISEYKGYTAAYGHIGGDGEPLDDGIATVFRAPHSYTGEDVVEISCHGGLLVTRKVLRAALDHGAKLAAPGEFTRRAFLNGKMSLTQAEAVADLISAGSERSLRTAKSAMDGALYKKIKGITDELLAVSAHLAAYIDYPEEDVDELTEQDILAICRESLGKLEHLLDNFDRGRLIREGVDTVIIGKPNVGKSTLMNLLSGCSRSIVTNIPGTTRDIVEETVNLGDVLLRLADTAGIRETDNPVEQIGVDIALERLEGAGLALAVFDLSEPLTEEDRRIIARLQELPQLPVVAILNKTDLPQRLEEAVIRENFPQVVQLSAGGDAAQQEAAIETLNRTVTDLLMLEGVDTQEAVLANERQRECAAEAAGLLREVVETIESGYTLDAVDVALESALSALFALSGEKVSDTVVDEVFSKFCVGK